MNPAHKKYIVKNSYNKPLKQIADELGIKERKVRRFLDEIKHGQDKDQVRQGKAYRHPAINFLARPAFYIFTAFIVISSFFAIKSMLANLDFVAKNARYFSGKTLEEKYTAIDGDFYKFLAFCKSRIPANSQAVVYSSWEQYQQIYGPRAYYQFLYVRQKTKYFLYPIVANAFYFAPDGAPAPYSDEDMLKKVDFIIVFSTDRDFPGFIKKHVYDDSHYILVKE